MNRSGLENRLATSKTGKPRTLPLEGELADLIEQRWKAREFKREALRRTAEHRSSRPATDSKVAEGSLGAAS